MRAKARLRCALACKECFVGGKGGEEGGQDDEKNGGNRVHKVVGGDCCLSYSCRYK